MFHLSLTFSLAFVILLLVFEEFLCMKALAPSHKQPFLSFSPLCCLRWRPAPFFQCCPLSLSLGVAQSCPPQLTQGPSVLSPGSCAVSLWSLLKTFLIAVAPDSGQEWSRITYLIFPPDRIFFFLCCRARAWPHFRHFLCSVYQKVSLCLHISHSALLFYNFLPA